MVIDWSGLSTSIEAHYVRSYETVECVSLLGCISSGMLVDSPCAECNQGHHSPDGKFRLLLLIIRLSEGPFDSRGTDEGDVASIE